MVYEWEIQKAAYILVTDMTNIKPGENVLIYADTVTNRQVVEATASAAHAVGGEVTVVWIETRPQPGIEPPPPLREALKAADVVIEFATQYIGYTQAYIDSWKKYGSRNMELCGMNPEMMVRLIGRVNRKKLLEFGEKLCEITRKAKRIEITSPEGTDFTGDLDGRPIVLRSGIIREPGMQENVGGQITFLPLEETANGTMVFDAEVYPPCGLLREPIEVDFKEGKIVEIRGGVQAKEWERWIQSFNDPYMYQLAHISYGIVPGAKLTGDILEDERIFGCITTGMGFQPPHAKGKGGPAKAHHDGIMLHPTVKLDGVIIEKEGEYVHPELVKLMEELQK